MLTLDALSDLRDEFFADDIPITDEMRFWSVDQARQYFESGGTEQVVAPVAQVAEPTPVPSASAPTASRPGARAFTAIKLFGDSHVNTFITIEATDGAVPLLAYPYTAGSAMGLRHADSITGYRAALEGDLRASKPTELIVLKFGQVDCDFVYYLKLADQPALRFDDFAADSVRKYFSFVDDALASLPVAKNNLRIMTNFATCVPDSHLRESLCTLPFMRADFKARFRAKLEAMSLPSLAQRTANGRAYAALLRKEASARGLGCVDVRAAASPPANCAPPLAAPPLPRPTPCAPHRRPSARSLPRRSTRACWAAAV